MPADSHLPTGPPPEPPVPTARGPSPPNPEPPRSPPDRHRSRRPPPATEQTGQDDEPDTAAVELHEQLRRKADENRKSRTGGRHARRDGNDAEPPADYVPRHAMSIPGPGTLPPRGT